MKSGIVVLSANAEEGTKLCELLDQRQFHATPVDSIPKLEKHVQENDCQLVLIDLDTLSMDTTGFRKLKRMKPSLNIIGLSSRSFHPELKEAMSNHIYACLNKPVDEDDLMFCIKSLMN